MTRTSALLAVAAAATAAALSLGVRRLRRDSGDEVVRHYFEAWSNGEPGALQELLADDYRGHVHTLAGTEDRDAKELAAVLEGHGDAFEWTEFEIRDLVRENERLAARVAMRTRHRETGREGEIDVLAIFRLSDGRIAEEWSSWDYLGLANQLGLAEVS